jgi:hypothetical protein
MASKVNLGTLKMIRVHSNSPGISPENKLGKSMTFQTYPLWRFIQEDQEYVQGVILNIPQD